MSPTANSTETSKVGILGVANISSKTAIAIANDLSECQIAAVASRSLEKAQKFVEEHHLDSDRVRIFGGNTAYADLIVSKEIDALYIPLPVAVKKEWVLKALEAGKHVVVEKPVALSTADYQEFLAMARSKNCFLMDGTMFPHHPRTQTLAELAALGSAGHNDLGEVHRLQCQFCFLTDHAWETSNIRASPKGDPQGCIGDLGWYCIRFGIIIFGEMGLMPINVQVVDFACNTDGVPMDATCVVRFEKERVLWFHCSFKTAFRQRFEICGSKQFVLVDDLVLPSSVRASYHTESSHLTKHDLLTVYDRDSIQLEQDHIHEVLLWKKFSSICKELNKTPPDNDSSNESLWIGSDQENRKDSTLISRANRLAQDSLQNQRIMDALMTSIQQGGSVVNL